MVNILFCPSKATVVCSRALGAAAAVGAAGAVFGFDQPMKFRQALDLDLASFFLDIFLEGGVRMLQRM